VSKPEQRIRAEHRSIEGFLEQALTAEQRSRVLPYKDPSDWERFMEGLRLSGLPPR